MIVPMKKYDLVLLRSQRDDFLERLQDLGLVDITTTGWEPDEAERELMVSVDRHRNAGERLRMLAVSEGFEPGEAYETPQQAWEAYERAAAGVDSINERISLLTDEMAQAEAWGEFDPFKLDALAKSGVALRYFTAYTKEFGAQIAQWEKEYTVVPVSDGGGTTYFVVVTAPGAEVHINAQEVKPPTATPLEKREEIDRLVEERKQWDAQLARAASSVELIAEHGRRDAEALDLSRAARSGREEAEGTLVIMEGWATRETETKVDEMLEEYPGILYIKSDPTPQDETPTLLKNNRFNRMFEIIGNFYTKPKYGSMDLTPFFGPFYVLFFGLCLADAGYGLLFFIAGLVLRRKVSEQYRPMANLVTAAGVSTIVCGMFLGSIFGMEIEKMESFAWFRDCLLSRNNAFILALAIGVIQILFGMTLKVVMYTKQYGFKYALSTLGWLTVIVSSLIYLGPAQVGMEPVMGSTVYFILLAAGLFMMLFLNSPGKNPLVNFGAGLWDTYNNVTGLLGDVLSYIRLFAIGLSGGILALVFNQLAMELSPDIPVLKQIVMVAILLIGHGLTLFMGSLSAFVHPMRLTFVEFYNNAGFESTQREFTPLKKKEEK